MIPTEEQRAAIESDVDRILCVSGPGSGKTGTLIERIFRLVRDGAQPENMAAITYTNSAAKEMEDRLAPEDGKVSIALGFCGTLHSFCLWHLQLNGYKDFTVLDQTEADAELERAAHDCNVNVSLKKLKRMKENFLSEPSSLRNPTTESESMNAKGFNSPCAFSTRLAVGNYYRRLDGERLLDYDSILHIALKSMQNKASIAVALEHLFVDEFQDASALDMEIYEAISTHNRFYVGDPRQSIFSFRGGSLEPFRKLDGDPTWRKVALSVNFRSGPEIVEAANRLISHATDQPETARLSAPKALKPLGDTGTELSKGSIVQARLWGSDEAEAAGIAEAIRRHGGAKDCYAVLARTRAVANLIGDTLEEAGIPVRRKKKVRHPEEWIHAQAAVRALHLRTPDAVLRFLMIKNGDYARHLKGEHDRGEDIVKLTPFGKHTDLWTSLSELGVMPDTVERIGELWAALTEKTLPNLALAMAQVKADEETVGDGVFVGTIHGAKGQEFDFVVLAGFEDGIIPSNNADIEEERRIAYVGMTRARLGLWITCAQLRQRWRGNGGRTTLSDMEASQFIYEAGLEL